MIALYAKAIAVNAATAVLVTLASEKALELFKIPKTTAQNMFFKRVDLCPPFKLKKVSPEKPSEPNHPSM